MMSTRARTEPAAYGKGSATTAEIWIAGIFPSLSASSTHRRGSDNPQPDQPAAADPHGVVCAVRFGYWLGVGGLWVSLSATQK